MFWLFLTCWWETSFPALRATFSLNCYLFVIFFDLRKAFDSVNRHSSVENFYAWHYWSPSFFNGFIVICLVEYTKCLSTLAALAVCKLDQASLILGPLLFLIYANDMFSVVSTKLLLFADDSQCFHRINHLSDCCLLQRDLDNLSDWADRCGMCFNTPHHQVCIHELWPWVSWV